MNSHSDLALLRGDWVSFDKTGMQLSRMRSLKYVLMILRTLDAWELCTLTVSLVLFKALASVDENPVTGGKYTGIGPG